MKKDQVFCAVACVRGGEQALGIRGTVRFCQQQDGVRISIRVCGLPDNQTGFFGLHIHEGPDCEGFDFANTGSHFDHGVQPHPRHTGDLPPLLSCGGKAQMCVLTDRFTVGDIIGRTVVIHSGPDDFRTQPAGNAGEKIACGVIRER